MDTFEFNKIAGAVLSALLVATVIGFIGNALVAPKRLAENAFPVAVEQPTQQAQQPAEAAPKAEPIAPLLAKADASAGQGLFKQCAACHTADKGGPNRVGPNLWGVVGGPKAHAQGFNYSQAMQAAAQKPGEDGRWTYENLNQFLANPKGYLPGTRMAYAGLRRTEDRANLLAWLRTQSDNPPPLP